MRTAIGLVSALLTAICVVPYLYDIARGTTRPQRVSWFVFATLSMTAAVAQWLEGAVSGALLATGAAIGFGAVAAVSIRRGEGGASRRDLVALAVAAIGVTLSIAADRPLMAIVAVIVAEVAAISLTARKARIDPDSETMSTWVIDAVAGAIAIVAAPALSLTALAYPVHHSIVNIWVVMSIRRGAARRPAPTPR